MMKNLRGVLSFVESAACGSFTAAAARLELTPAAVSKNVIGLERQLRVRLFNRSTRRLKLTREGEAFLAKASLALRTLDEGIEEATQASGEAAGRVRVSTAPSFGRHFVLPLLPGLARRHPRLQIELNLDARMVDLVAEGFDIGIRGGVMPDSSLVARRVARLPVVLAASPAYLRRRGVPESHEALSGHATLGVCSSSGAAATWRFRRPSRRGMVDWEPNAQVWASDPEALIDLALAGDGIVQVALHLAAQYLRSGRLKVVLFGHHDAGEREIALHYPHRQLLSTRVRVVVDSFLAHFKAQRDLHLDRERIPLDWRA